MKTRTLALSIVTAALLGVSASNAYARCSSGEIANWLCEGGVISKDEANTADAIHERMGRPMDHAAPAIGGAIAGPYGAAAGRMWLENDARRRAMHAPSPPPRFHGHQPPMYAQAPMYMPPPPPPPMYVPPPMYGAPVFGPPPMMMPMYRPF